ncbi:MAG: aminotransferase class I/II-fold pyridoxal phosphate-dependent enzyme [candidate division WS1 bacterium]|nr:aminotransferase class I/II-fold pyridoxal phosphate-dependent enzyme [candidate division WS1 bacterium]
MQTALRPSRLARELPPNGIREFFDLVQTRSEVISLGVGEPDFATPWRICDAAIEGMRRGQTSYTSNYGTLELREAIAEDLERRYAVSYDPGTEILVTAGVSEAMDLAMRALLDTGEEVIVPEPCYVSYRPCVDMTGGRSVGLETRMEDRFILLPEALEAALTPATRAFTLCYPNNPTGAVMTRQELLPLAELAEKHDLVVISDEIYAHLRYIGQHTCFASLPGMRERTILLNGFSKAYAMTGWRLGYACGPAEIIEAMMRIHSYTALCASSMAQTGALEALRHGEQDMQEMVAQYDQRRRLLLQGYRELGLPCFDPGGAFYTFPSIAHTGLTSAQFAKALLFEENVAAVPGTAFGPCGEGHIRATYATHMDLLKEALERLGRFLEKLQAGQIKLEA